MKSILSEVVSKYSRHTENICSESLALIVNESNGMQDAFCQFISERTNGKVALLPKIRINTQVTSKTDTAIPDLMVDDASELLHLIEAKFWAGLTDHQPNEYLARIVKQGGSLGFLVPERRKTSLLSELKTRVATNYTITIEENQVLVDNNTWLYVFSWTDLIDYLWHRASLKEDKESLFNLYQLKGLIQKLDSEGFIPFESELFTPMAGKQRDQLIDLIDSVVDSSSQLDTKKLSYGGGKYSYQRFFKINGKYGGYILYSSELWLKFQETPLFFCVSAKEWTDSTELPDIDQLSKNLEATQVRTLGVLDINSYPALVIPLSLPIGMDKEKCIAIVDSQVQIILSII